MDIVVLCPKTLNSFQTEVLKPFLESEYHRICGCVVDNRPVKPALQRLVRNLRKGRGGYVLIMALELIIRRKREAAGTGAESLMRETDVPVIFTEEPYSDETIAWIKARSPEALALIGGFGIVKAPLLNLAPHGVLSYHHGDMRRYRGMPPAFWEMYNGEREMGVTVQVLSAGLDSGMPVVEESIPIESCDTVASLQTKAFEASKGMLYKAVVRLDSGDFVPVPVDELGPVYTLPNLRQWIVLNLRVLRRKLKCRMAR